MIENLRNKIDNIDNQLIKLLEKRFEIAIEIANYKKYNNIPILQKDRENIILNKVKKTSKDELSRHIINIFKYILSTSKKIQQENIK